MPNIELINKDLTTAPESRVPHKGALGTLRGSPSTLELWRLAEVCRVTGLSRSAVYRLAADGTLVPVRVTARTSAWLRQEVEAFIAERVDARNAKVGTA